MVLGLFFVGCEEEISASGLGEIEITIISNDTSDYYSFEWENLASSTTGSYIGSDGSSETPMATDDWLDDHEWKFSLDIFSPGTYDFTISEHTLTLDGSGGFIDTPESHIESNVVINEDETTRITVDFANP